MSEMIQNPRGGAPDATPPRPPGGWRGGPDPAVDPSGDTVSVGQYLRGLVRRKWWVIGLTAAVVVIAAVQVWTTTPLYESKALLQVDPEHPKILPYQEVTEPGFSDRTSEEYLLTQVNSLRTRELARRVILRLGLRDDPAFNRAISEGLFSEVIDGAAGLVRGLLGAGRTAAEPQVAATGGAGEGAAAEPAVGLLTIDRFRGGLSVGMVRDTRLLEVGYTSADPGLSARIVNALIDEFIELQFEKKYQATQKAVEFLQRQLDDLKLRVERSEVELVRYARERNIVNLDERTTTNLEKLNALSNELNRLEVELATESALFDSLRQATPERFPESLETPFIADLEARLAESERRLAALSERHGPNWPAVQSLLREVDQLTSQLRAEKAAAIEAARSDYDLTAEEYERMAAALERQRRVVDRLNEDFIQYNVLEREVETNQELYRGLLTRLKEAGVLAGLRSSNVHVVDEAVPPLAPAVPQKTLALSLALLVGLLLGVGSAVVGEALDNTVKTSDDVAHLGLPSLGMIPRMPADERSDALAEGAPLIPIGLPQGSQARFLEAYRSLRTSLLLSSVTGQPPQVIQVTSALPGEGKTTTAVNTAMVLARTGTRTLLVDLDLRKPELARLFGVSGQQGVSTYLSGVSDLSSQIRETAVPNLFLLPAGPPAPNPPELIGSARMASAFDLLREYFTHVVVDTPPTLELSDAQVAAPRADGVVLVARSGRTSRGAVARAGAEIERVGGRLLGVVVNAVDRREAPYDYDPGYYLAVPAAGEEPPGPAAPA